MLTRIICLLFILSAILNLHAQEETHQEDQKSKFGLIFSLSGLDDLRLNEFDGGIGGKYFLNERLALRGVLDLSVSSTNSEISSTLGSDELDSFSLGISSGVEFHFRGRDRMSPYLGAEFGVHTSSSNFTNTADTISLREVDNDLISYRGGVFLGFEIYPVKFFSMSGEYGLSLSFGSTKSTTTENNMVTRRESDAILLETSSKGLLILTFYL